MSYVNTIIKFVLEHRLVNKFDSLNQRQLRLNKQLIFRDSLQNFKR